jgi:hypothetical protein
MCLTSDSPCWTGTLRDDLRLGRCGVMPPPGAKRPGLSVVRSLGSASLSQRGVIPTVKPAALEGERTTVLGQGAVVWFEVFVPGIVTAKPSKHGQEPRKPGGSRATFRPVSRGSGGRTFAERSARSRARHPASRRCPPLDSLAAWCRPRGCLHAQSVATSSGAEAFTERWLLTLPLGIVRSLPQAVIPAQGMFRPRR